METADVAKEILNGKLRFLCSVACLVGTLQQDKNGDANGQEKRNFKIPKLKTVRDSLLITHSENLIDGEIFLLLFDVNRSTTSTDILEPR